MTQELDESVISGVGSDMLSFSRVIVCAGKTQVINTTKVLQFFLKHTSTDNEFTTNCGSLYQSQNKSHLVF